MATEGFNEQRARMFGSLEKIYQDAHQHRNPDSITPESGLILTQTFGLSPLEAIHVTTEFIFSKISATMEGHVRILPELNQIPDKKKHNRFSSWTWFYIESRAHNYRRGGNLLDDLIFRSRFEFGNADEDSFALLEWCDQNPKTVARLYREMVERDYIEDLRHPRFIEREGRTIPIGGEASRTGHLVLLDKFIWLEGVGQLNPLDLPTEKDKQAGYFPVHLPL